MAEESSEDLAWLLRPPEPGHIHLHVRVGEGVEFTDEQRAALEALTKAFYEEEVEGFASTCRPEHCGVVKFCVADFCRDYTCEVQKTFRAFGV
jgi:hypothetical protein